MSLGLKFLAITYYSTLTGYFFMEKVNLIQIIFFYLKVQKKLNFLKRADVMKCESKESVQNIEVLAENAVR